MNPRRTVSSSNVYFFLLWSFCILCEIAWVGTTISPSSKGKKVKAPKEIKTGAVDASVFDRNLVEEEPLANDILIENGAYYKDTSIRLFNSTVLGYVTPVSV